MKVFLSPVLIITWLDCELSMHLFAGAFAAACEQARTWWSSQGDLLQVPAQLHLLSSFQPLDLCNPARTLLLSEELLLHESRNKPTKVRFFLPRLSLNRSRPVRTEGETGGLLQT